MRAAVYKGGKRFAIEEIPDPTPGPGQVVVDVHYSAICGSDVHQFMYDIAPVGEVMGHEYSGVVSAVGDGVARWKEGDRVIGGGGEPTPEAQARNRTLGDRFNWRLESRAGTGRTMGLCGEGDSGRVGAYFDPGRRLGCGGGDVRAYRVRGTRGAPVPDEAG